MKKFNNFCEKYESPLWQLIASIWFFIEYFRNKEINSLLNAGIFFAVFAIFDIIRIKLSKKQ